MLLATWIYFRKPPLGGRSNTKPVGDHDTSNAHNCWIILFYHVWGPTWIEIHWHNIWLRIRSHMTSHYTWGSVTTLHDLEVVWDGLGKLCFGLSQFHGHSSWLVCEVALSWVFFPHHFGADMLIFLNRHMGFCRYSYWWEKWYIYI